MGLKLITLEKLLKDTKAGNNHVKYIRYRWPIGIGMPITERPSRSSGHTGHIQEEYENKKAEG